MAATKKTAATRKRRELRKVDKGQVHIQSTFNNTMITFTDLNGNVLAWSSAGSLGGFRGSKKGTPYAAQLACEKAAAAAKEYGLKSVEVYALASFDLEITLISDVSPIPHNGCRPPKRRRV